MLPDDIVSASAASPKEKQAEEGITLAVEQIRNWKEVEGVRGFHIMAIEWKKKLGKSWNVAASFPRPQLA